MPALPPTAVPRPAQTHTASSSTRTPAPPETTFDEVYRPHLTERRTVPDPGLGNEADSIDHENLAPATEQSGRSSVAPGVDQSSDPARPGRDRDAGDEGNRPVEPAESDHPSDSPRAPTASTSQSAALAAAAASMTGPITATPADAVSEPTTTDDTARVVDGGHVDAKAAPGAGPGRSPEVHTSVAAGPAVPAPTATGPVDPITTVSSGAGAVHPAGAPTSTTVSTQTPTATPTATPELHLTPTPTPTATSTTTPEPHATPTPTATSTTTPEPHPTPTPEPFATPTPTLTSTPEPQATPGHRATPTPVPNPDGVVDGTSAAPTVRPPTVPPGEVPPTSAAAQSTTSTSGPSPTPSPSPTSVIASTHDGSTQPTRSPATTDDAKAVAGPTFELASDVMGDAAPATDLLAGRGSPDVVPVESSDPVPSEPVPSEPDASGGDTAGADDTTSRPITTTSVADRVADVRSSTIEAPSNRAAGPTPGDDPTLATTLASQRRATAHAEANDLLARAELRRLTAGGSRLGIDLGTTDLGPIRIEAVDRGSGLQLHLRSDQASTRAVLDAHLAELRDELRADGFDLGSLDVTSDGRDRPDSEPSPGSTGDRDALRRSTALPRASITTATATSAPPGSTDGIDLRL